MGLLCRIRRPPSPGNIGHRIRCFPAIENAGHRIQRPVLLMAGKHRIRSASSRRNTGHRIRHAEKEKTSDTGQKKTKRAANTGCRIRRAGTVAMPDGDPTFHMDTSDPVYLDLLNAGSGVLGLLKCRIRCTWTSPFEAIVGMRLPISLIPPALPLRRGIRC